MGALFDYHLGRSLAVVPRHVAECGYIDMAHDDYADPDLFKTLQDEARLVSEGIIVGLVFEHRLRRVENMRANLRTLGICWGLSVENLPPLEQGSLEDRIYPRLRQ